MLLDTPRGPGHPTCRPRGSHGWVPLSPAEPQPADGPFLPDEELEFFVRQEDMILCDEICKALDRTLEIKPADDIKLGGVKAVGIKTESLADDTLDTKLEEQKKLFVEHSGFKI